MGIVVWYVVMNVSALVAGLLVDLMTVRYSHKHDAMDDDGENGSGGDGRCGFGVEDASNRAIILSGVVADAGAVFVAFGVREIKVDAGSKVGAPLPFGPTFDTPIRHLTSWKIATM